MPDQPEIELVVIQPFAGRAKGEVITDPAEMTAAPAHCVVRRAKAPAPPPPAPAAASAPPTPPATPAETLPAK
jgi:hypothetical protein